MSAIRPHSKRVRSLASSVSMSFGGLSLEMIICFPHNYDNNACHSQWTWLSGLDRSGEEYKDDNTVQGKTSGRKNDHKAESSEQDRLDNDVVPSYFGNSRILSVGAS